MNKDKKEVDLSRRHFMGVAGGIVGASALASMGLFSTSVQANTPQIKEKDFTSHSHKVDVLVIGGGIAGVFAAKNAYDTGATVAMVVKGRLGSSGLTPFGKGIFCFDKTKEKLSIDEYVAKISASALNTNHDVFTKQTAEHSYARIQELKSWGFFDSPLYHDSFMVPMKARFDTQQIHTFLAKTVVLCTGSGGFKPNGFPMCDLTHDGTIMAYKIGAKVTGKEWNDGHMASAKHPGDCYNGWHGQIEENPSLVGVDVHHDLGVDLNYSTYVLGGKKKTQSMPLAKTDSGKPSGPPGMMQQETVAGGPYVPKAFQHQGMPPGEPPKQSVLTRIFGEDKPHSPPGMNGESIGGATAGMAIHKSEGLVPMNEEGLSNIPGLYAAGDALGSRLAGGIYTQIGCSMAGSAVQGAIAGEAAGKASKKLAEPSFSATQLAKIKTELLAPLNRERGYSPSWVTQTLQGIMIPNFVLYIKKERMLQAALAYVEELKEHFVPFMIASNLHELRLAHETENMVITAEMKLRASLMRKESRCSHYRLDYPHMDNENWQAWINLYQGEDGSMQLEKQPFGQWPKA